jgi:hypothetical protein
MVRRPYLVAVAVAALTMGVAIVGSLTLDRPIRDPDGVLGPSWVRLPLIVLVFFLADVVPRALGVRRSTGIGLIAAGSRSGASGGPVSGWDSSPSALAAST